MRPVSLQRLHAHNQCLVERKADAGSYAANLPAVLAGNNPNLVSATKSSGKAARRAARRAVAIEKARMRALVATYTWCKTGATVNGTNAECRFHSPERELEPNRAAPIAKAPSVTQNRPSACHASSPKVGRYNKTTRKPTSQTVTLASTGQTNRIASSRHAAMQAKHRMHKQITDPWEGIALEDEEPIVEDDE